MPPFPLGNFLFRCLLQSLHCFGFRLLLNCEGGIQIHEDSFCHKGGLLQENRLPFSNEQRINDHILLIRREHLIYKRHILLLKTPRTGNEEDPGELLGLGPELAIQIYEI